MLKYSAMYPYALSAWFLAFSFFTVCAAQSAKALADRSGEITELSRLMGGKSRELKELSKRTRSREEEMKTISQIVSLIPEERGFLRTQKAIAEDVIALRRKVSRWVGRDRIYIVVDTKANKLYLKKGLDLILDADCSVGRGGILRDKATGRAWEFVTPLGEFRVRAKIENPVWIKPDWAFVESKEPIPPPGDPSRRAEGELGAYVLNLGDGYLIHGTKNEQLLGTAVSHGCVRLGAENLKLLYETVQTGTRVYIY